MFNPTFKKVKTNSSWVTTYLVRTELCPGICGLRTSQRPAVRWRNTKNNRYTIPTIASFCSSLARIKQAALTSHDPTIIAVSFSGVTFLPFLFDQNAHI